MPLKPVKKKPVKKSGAAGAAKRIPAAPKPRVAKIGAGIPCTVNGKPLHLDCPPGARLLDVLRETLFLTGTKEGCGKGECGACTVLVNGTPVDSCLMFAIQAKDAAITTIEGISGASPRELHPIQRQFIAKGGVQCGICIPGMIVAAKALLDERPHATREEIFEGLGGNLCRCTGYLKIIEAVEAARDELNPNQTRPCELP